MLDKKRQLEIKLLRKLPVIVLKRLGPIEMMKRKTPKKLELSENEQAEFFGNPPRNAKLPVLTFMLKLLYGTPKSKGKS